MSIKLEEPELNQLCTGLYRLEQLKVVNPFGPSKVHIEYARTSIVHADDAICVGFCN